MNAKADDSVKALETAAFRDIDALGLDPYEALGAQTVVIGTAYLLRADRSTVEKEFDGVLLPMYDALFPES